jgi:lipopolysaccharide transport system permease protein
MKTAAMQGEAGRSPDSSAVGLGLPTIEIQRSRGWKSLGLRDVWEYRELLLFLVWREIQGPYRQTALGLSWLFLRPLLNVALLTLVFGRLVRVPSDNVPYPLFSLAALLPWGFFSTAVQRASRSLVDNMHVISKVYFPRLVVPIAGASSGVMDLAASACVVFLALALCRMPAALRCSGPVFILIALGFALATAFGLPLGRNVATSSAVNFLLQGLPLSVIFSVSIVPSHFSFV